MLEAGKSIRLLAIVGLTPGKNAYAAIADEMQSNEATRSRISIERALSKKGLDLFDNPVAPIISDGTAIGWRVERAGKEQVFLFKLHTARGTTAFDVSSWYDLDRNE